MIFDTLKVSQKLRENGRFSEDQALTLVEAFSGGSIDNLVTKADLRAEAADLRTEFRTDFAKVRTEIKEMENRLFVRLSAVIGLGVTITGLLIHFVK